MQLDYSYGVIDVTHPCWTYCLLDLSVIHLSNLGAGLGLERTYNESDVAETAVLETFRWISQCFS